ncbi:MAG: YggS family pyridoxal phosphate-dependent enzyme [Anaerolineae bacterium]|jgi:pyridoxal phosphate enzyme (YggS family)|nr:YggS family pyridoxal phosphate-dependent enzyme [Chloroflexota bacterium]
MYNGARQVIRNGDVDASGSTIAANLARIELTILEACRRSGRRREEVQLIAVSKGRSVEEILAALACGLHQLGENRIEELEAKRPLVEQCAAAPVWHMIGHVQSRKAARVAAAGILVHSVDSVRLAERLDRQGAELGQAVRVLLQVNVSGEASKQGLDAATPAEIQQLLSDLDRVVALPHLQIEGLMTMAPQVPDPELARPVFAGLREVRDLCQERYPHTRWDTLSMGMSADYAIAIEEGATCVRVGRALFEPIWEG